MKYGTRNAAVFCLSKPPFPCLKNFLRFKIRFKIRLLNLISHLIDRRRLKFWYNIFAFSEENVGLRNRAGEPSEMMLI